MGGCKKNIYMMSIIENIIESTFSLAKRKVFESVQVRKGPNILLGTIQNKK